MGLYDRDYERERNYYNDGPGFRMTPGAWSMNTKLIVFMFAVYVVQLITRESGWFTSTFSLHPDVFRRPWQAYQLLTYGFLHDPTNISHIVWNMVALFFFGRPIEQRYGSREYITFFCTAVVFAGLVWLVGELITNGGGNGDRIRPIMLGASGGISAVLILFAMNYPHQTVYFMLLFPMPMWVLALIIVIVDAYGALSRSGKVAFTAHLGGAAFGYLYYKWGRRLGTLLPGEGFWNRIKPGPKLRVLDPDQAEADESRMDEILKKIQEHGQDSLTRSERRFLEKASLEYQKRRR